MKHILLKWLLASVILGLTLYGFLSMMEAMADSTQAIINQLSI